MSCCPRITWCLFKWASLDPAHRNLHMTLWGWAQIPAFLQAARCSRIRWSVYHTIRKAALKPSQRSNPCVRGHTPSCFQRMGSGSSFSFSSYIQSVTSFCCSVLTFSLCVYPLLKLLTPNLSKCMASLTTTTPAKSAPARRTSQGTAG